MHKALLQFSLMISSEFISQTYNIIEVNMLSLDIVAIFWTDMSMYSLDIPLCAKYNPFCCSAHLQFLCYLACNSLLIF
jgi:hypothetical protein